MVKLDLEVGEVVGLAENGKITKERLNEHLKKYTVEELASFITQFYSEEDEELDQEEDEDQEE